MTSYKSELKKEWERMDRMWVGLLMAMNVAVWMVLVFKI